MKTKTKLISTILTPAAILPLASLAATSCSQEKTIIDVLYDSMIQEFYTLCKIPRPTYHTQHFMYWLIYHIYGIFSDEKDFKGVIIDKGYEPFEPSTDYGTNFYFDIPASSPKNQNYPTIILQCHTDMVWQTIGDDVPDKPIPVKDWKNGKLVIHTEGYKTSLGADNGAGIAICLAIARHYKEFDHGPIRVLMTTDEEDGPSGAVSVPKNWFDGCQYLVNLDLEESMRVCESTAGVQQMAWTKTFSTVQPADVCDNGYTIIIDGLYGGHSAKAITMNRANSIKLGWYLLNEFNNEFGSSGTEEGLQLCSVREMKDENEPKPNEGHNCPTTPGSIPKYLKIVFASDHDFDKPELNGSEVSGFQEWLDTKINKWRAENPNIIEDSLTVIGDVVDNPPPDASPLSTGDSVNIIKFLHALPFGYEPWPGKEENIPITSYNIGGFRINDGDYSKPNADKTEIPVYIEVFARSADEDTLGPDNQGDDPSLWQGMMKEYYEISEAVWEKSSDKGKWESVGWNPVWVHDSTDKLTDILIKGGQEAGYDPKPLDEHSWLEIGAFAQKKPELDIAAIGPTIDDVHSVRETFYVETAKPMFAMLLYAFEHLDKEVKYE